LEDEEETQPVVSVPIHHKSQPSAANVRMIEDDSELKRELEIIDT
jgi:hypothetical protein